MSAAEPKPPKPAASWLRFTVDLESADVRRSLCRALKKSGGRQICQQAGQVRALVPGSWPSIPGYGRIDELLAGQEPVLAPCQGPEGSIAGWELAPGLTLAPAWSGARADARTLVIDELTAFGGGGHPSTRLNLRFLAGLKQAGWQPPEGAWLADVGAGTGVLALALALFFTRPVLALDPEPASRRAFTRNQALNPLAGPWVHFVLGRHDILAGPFQLSAANLPGPILLTAAPRLAHTLAPDGWLCLSGFRQSFAGQVRDRFAELGLELERELHEGDWAGLLLRAKAKGG